ncbi:MAG: 2-C-methyl-D-erythritol 2,4-cyclodiphosphate synthase [Clostridia bacterium]|nr:2-C-methyl-D-erythritol 2,4-cyclodiphosphate synthase [Clostridia bacterium]
MRIGHGYDVHRYVENRKLILGGVEIPYKFGLLGHSDADVLVHAIIDSLIGALCLGDIGKLFPDTDIKYKNIDSLILLKHVNNIIIEKKYEIINIDSTIVIQEPKLSSYINNIRKNIADTCKININDINVKAKTEENLGFTGALQGVAAHAVVLINNKN